MFFLSDNDEGIQGIKFSPSPHPWQHTCLGWLWLSLQLEMRRHLYLHRHPSAALDTQVQLWRGNLQEGGWEVVLPRLTLHWERSWGMVWVDFWSWGKNHGTISAVQMDFVQIAFQPPPPLKQPDPLGLLFSPKISQFFKTAVLTMGIDIFKMTMVKHYS